MLLCPRYEQGCTVPRRSSIKTAVFHTNCLLGTRQGQDTWYTLNVSVPLSDSVSLYDTLLHLSLLQLRPPRCHVICILHLHEGLQGESHMLHISEVTMRVFFYFIHVFCVGPHLGKFEALEATWSNIVWDIHIISFLVNDYQVSTNLVILFSNEFKHYLSFVN